MKTSSFLLGILATFAFGLVVVVAIPYSQLAFLGQQHDEAEDVFYPMNVPGLAQAGEKVYGAEGCISCHSQQVRAPLNGGDNKQSWGARQSVARDYITRDQVYLGGRRIGPDLATIGDEKRGKTALWIHQHLYDPRALNPLSIAPSYRHLYTLRKITGQPSENAVPIPTGAHVPAFGFEVVPTRQAVELVAYLQSLNLGYTLPESKLPGAAKK